MPFPLLISLRESLLELCSALPVALPAVPPQAGSGASRALPSWVCKAIVAGCVRAGRGHVMAKRAPSVAITGSPWRSAVGLEPCSPQS